MTWKRCPGCTRAISSAALTCEYCGQLCDEVLDGLPIGDSDQAKSAWRPEASQPDSAADLVEDDSLHGLPALELKPSFPFTETEDDPRSDNPLSDVTLDDVAAPLGPVFPDEEPAFVMMEAEAESAPSETAAASAGAPAPPVAAGKKQVGSRQVVMLGGALVAASALIFTILSMRPSASPETVVQTAAAPAPARKPAANRATPAARTSSAPVAPKWSQVTAGRWTGGDRKSVAFELQANNRIHIWTRDVTPVLVVRCQAGQVEPFVYTQSAARMEPQDGDHTVKIAFDGGPEATERWPDSDEHDALFAKDSTAFTHQLATAKTLRLGFEPHNAVPAVMHFDVSGLNELLSAAKPCNWKR